MGEAARCRLVVVVAAPHLAIADATGHRFDLWNSKMARGLLRGGHVRKLPAICEHDRVPRRLVERVAAALRMATLYGDRRMRSNSGVTLAQVSRGDISQRDVGTAGGSDGPYITEAERGDTDDTK